MPRPVVKQQSGEQRRQHSLYVAANSALVTFTTHAVSASVRCPSRRCRHAREGEGAYRVSSDNRGPQAKAEGEVEAKSGVAVCVAWRVSRVSACCPYAKERRTSRQCVCKTRRAQNAAKCVWRKAVPPRVRAENSR